MTKTETDPSSDRDGRSDTNNASAPTNGAAQREHSGEVSVEFEASSTDVLYQREQAADSPLATFLHEPPPYIARGLIYLTLTLVAALIGWSALSEIDIIVEAPSKVVPAGRLVVVESAVAGIIREIHLREGDEVAAGGLLVTLESENVSKTLADLRARAAELELAEREVAEVVPAKVSSLKKRMDLQVEDFAARRQSQELALRQINEIVKRYRLELKNVRGRIKLMDREITVNKILQKKGIVAERKLLEIQRLREELDVQLGVLASKIRESGIERQQRQSDFTSATSQHAATLTDLRQQILDMEQASSLEQRRAKIRYDEIQSVAAQVMYGVSLDTLKAAARGDGELPNTAVITAPTDAIVADVLVQSIGQRVEIGEVLMRLVPRGARLSVDINIPGRDIGMVREGQPIKFKFDAFPFGEFGVLSGTVENIRPSAAVDVKQDGKPYYRAESRLTPTFFRVKGKKVNLLPGMTATAEISTEKRSILSMILKPFAELAKVKQVE